MRIINKIGNEELLNREKSLFLCSKHAPYSVYDKVFGWVDSLTADDCVICFNSSELEDEVMRALLVNQVPTILVVMNRFTDKYNIQIEKALTEERMLILVLQRDEPYGAGQTPRLVTLASRICFAWLALARTLALVSPRSLPLGKRLVGASLS